MSFLSEFKAFAMRGNVVDLAVGVVIGAAFGKIVASLVDGIIMPLLGLILGGIDITTKTFKVGDAAIKWGAFLQSVIDFTVIALAIFIVIKLINLLNRQEAEKPAPLSKEETLLTEIRDLLKQNSQT